MRENPEIYFVTIIGLILGLLLVSFVVVMLFMYKRRQQKQEQEMASVKDKYEKEVLHSQLEIQENTFKTISQELHDNIGQLLSVIRLSLSSLPIEPDHKAFPMLDHSQKVLNKAIVDLSNLTKSLHTERITDLGLAESVSFELLSIRNAGFVDAKFSMTGEEFHLPDQKAIFLFRMFQEMVNNIIKHSAATRIRVELIYGSDNTFVMQVEDNGKGFDVEEVKSSLSSAKGVGLKSMFNRAKMIGADIVMNSEVNKGTQIIVKLSV